jgi:hypothetical protein
MVLVEGNPEISTIKIHSGEGRHKTSRIQIIGQNKNLDLKIINGSKSDYKGNLQEEIEAGRKFIFLKKE